MRVCSRPGCDEPHYARSFCNAHYQRWRRRYGGPALSGRTPLDRFWSKVDKSGPGGCWLWTGGVGSSGYGNFGKPTKLAHRVSYELEIGPIPEGMQLDHLCRVRTCVNPAHLEPVTARVNGERSENFAGVNARKEMCANGHPFDEANTAYRKRRDGRVRRACRACDRKKVATYRARKRAAG